jgi:protein-disulfide isomerase
MNKGVGFYKDGRYSIVTMFPVRACVCAFVPLVLALLILGCLGKDARPVGANASSLIDDGAVMGSAEAKVTIVEFSDFECPFCREFYATTFPALKSKYIDTGRLRFSYRNLPLPFHSNARSAAEAAECAGAQGKFWQMHDKLFENQGSLGEGKYRSLAGDIGLDMTEFNECMESRVMAQKVDKDIADARALNVTSVPTFYIGTKAYEGAAPLSEFEKAIGNEMNL